MSRETKLGYGFLLVGAGLPYLIDKLFGTVAALIAAALCLLGGIVFLVAGHLHRDKNAEETRKERSLMATIGMFTLVGAASGALIGGLSGAIWQIAHAKQPQSPGETSPKVEPIPNAKPAEVPPTKEANPLAGYHHPKSEPSVPPPLGPIRIASQKQVPSADSSLQYGIEVVVTTDASMSPTALTIRFSGEVGKMAGSPPGIVFTEAQGGIVASNPNTILIQWRTPPFGPETPLVITVFSATYIKAEKVESVPFRFPYPNGYLKNKD